jgi:hypothetical protein
MKIGSKSTISQDCDTEPAGADEFLVAGLLGNPVSLINDTGRGALGLPFVEVWHMRGEQECEGNIKFGPLPWELSEKLAQFVGNWLEYASDENALVVRKAEPIGCPAISGVPCEIINMIDSLPPEHRQAMPGGVFYVKDSGGQSMRVVVEKGEVRIQWPYQDFSRLVSVPPESVLSSMNPGEARIKGWARFAGAPSRAAEIQSFVNRFEGLFPEGDLPSEGEQSIAYVKLKSASIAPDDFVERLRSLADPPESLQAELEVKSYAPRAEGRDFRIYIRNGRIETFRPSIWKPT